MLVFVNHLTAVRITGTRFGTTQLSFADALVGSEFQIAGVAELADALDSKAGATLGSAPSIDIALTVFETASPALRLAQESN
jgi:hypothetical protein